MAGKTTYAKVTFLRVVEKGGIWGSGASKLETEVIVKVSTWPELAFGFELKTDDSNLPVRLGQLSMLKDAYINDREVGILADFYAGRKNGFLRRVEYGKS